MSQLNSPNIDTDFTLMDHLETISLLVKSADGSFAAALTVQNCLRRAQLRIVELGGDRIETADLTWHLWVKEMPANAPPPKYGDNITDINNVTWVILRVEYASWLTRYRCTCKRLGPGIG